MPRGAATEYSETRFWLRTVAVGGWVTLLMCLAGAAYAAGFAAAGHRLALGILVLVTAAIGATALWVVPWRRVIASRWREAALFTWSAVTIGVIAAMAALDGGADSPLALALVLPAVFASLAFQLRRVLLIGVLAEVAFLLLTLLGSPGAGSVLVFCAVLGGTIVMAVGQAGFHQEWRAQLARHSRTDPLTGLLNRRGLAIASAWSFHELFRQGSPVTLLLLDLDLFKAYNDTHGHREGDELLRWVGAELSAAVRPTDSVARLGGDEFAVLLPGTDCEAAEPLIRRLRDSLGSRISCCVGCATAPADGMSFDDLYRVGDSALYRHKLGRSERLFSAEAILGGVPQAFFAIDREGRFAYVNPAASRLLGRAANELLGHPLDVACPELVDSRLQRACRGAAETGRPERLVESWGSPGTRLAVQVDPIPTGVAVQLSELEEAAAPRRLGLQSEAGARRGAPPDEISITAGSR